MKDGGHQKDLDLLVSGCDSVYTIDELKQRLAGGKQLRVKLGMDPTAPDLTLGHTVVLRKLRQFQDLGHKAVLIIGDYTAMIGDPTGRSKTRPMLTAEQIATNAETYLNQAGQVLDVSADKLEVRHNSEWLAGLTFSDVIKLMSQVTVARMLERDTFAKRHAEHKEIYLHEMLYPIMQAHDSVAIKSDVELGGTDQTFNNLCGRDFQRAAGQPPQIVMTLPILIGTDGKDKMSKSMGNYIGVTDAPGDMFGKIMRIPDELMRQYFELLTDVPASTIDELVDPAHSNPRDCKEVLAKTIITQYHSADDAVRAADEFRRVHSGGGSGLPDDIPTFSIPPDRLSEGCIVPIDLLTLCGFEKTRGNARRIVAEHGIRLNGTVIEDALQPMSVKDGDILQRGRRKFVRLTLS